jgi:hypothetical protein
MIIISFRSVIALDPKYKSLEDKLKEVQRRYRYVTQAIEIQENYLKNATDEDEYRKIEAYIERLKRDAAEMKADIEKMKGTFTSFDHIGVEKEKYGFSMSVHGQDRYNQRFTPYLTRDQLFEVLSGLGLNKKITGDNSQAIRLLPNFVVVVTNREVVTFLYDEENKDQKIKHDLGNIFQKAKEGSK